VAGRLGGARRAGRPGGGLALARGPAALGARLPRLARQPQRLATALVGLLDAIGVHADVGETGGAAGGGPQIARAASQRERLERRRFGSRDARRALLGGGGIRLERVGAQERGNGVARPRD